MTSNWYVQLVDVVNYQLAAMESHNDECVFWRVFPLLCVSLKERSFWWECFVFWLFLLAWLLINSGLALTDFKRVNLFLELLAIPCVLPLYVWSIVVWSLTVIAWRLNAANFYGADFLIEKLLISISQLLCLHLPIHHSCTLFQSIEVEDSRDDKDYQLLQSWAETHWRYIVRIRRRIDCATNFYVSCWLWSK